MRRNATERTALREVQPRCSMLSRQTPEFARWAGISAPNSGRQHGVDLVDGIIAATSRVLQAPLVTLNRRHFPMLADVLVPYSQN